ncbi:MAG: hypoxanthine-guanine phosphoribosyltransferase [Cardiobacteriaceae bacterium]|nr:hypoxanthine-guanine phosphoribosyltransferase [Cardiobacteriaceae bacterium]
MQILDNKELEKVLAKSECLINSAEINAIYDRLAAQLNLVYAELNPIVIVVMSGGLIPAGQLLSRFSFFHRMDYLHASRYRNNVGGAQLNWKVRPTSDVTNEHILLIDDIFDEGITLKTIYEELEKLNPKTLKTCTLINKIHGHKVKNFTVDFVGTEVPDRYIYGCGMDYHGYLRHLPGIYAMKEE